MGEENRMGKNKINPLISIIIVNWNGKNNLKDCFGSLFKINYISYEVIVVDNGSKDGSVNYIKGVQKKHKNVILIENSTNLGFAEGNNVGYTNYSKGELVLLLNNDAIVDENFLGILVEKINSSKKIGAVQPKILMYPKKEIIDSAGSYFNWSGFLYHFGHNKPDQDKYNKEDQIFSMKGACMLFRREVIDLVGLFDPSYFAYFEETDLCQRIWMAGYKILYVPSSQIYHKGGETAKHLNNEFVQFNSYKNRIYTYLKNFQIGTILKILPIHIIYCQLIVLVYLFTFRFNASFAIERAIFWNIFNIPNLFMERRKVSKIRKVKDSDYLLKLTRRVRPSYYYNLFATSLAGYKD